MIDVISITIKRNKKKGILRFRTIIFWLFLFTL